MNKAGTPEIVVNTKCRSCIGHVNGSWQLFTKRPEASASLGRMKSGQIMFVMSPEITGHHI